MNKLEINIPEGMEIDWQESAKQERIVFKKKQLIYGDICKKLFERFGAYYIYGNGVIRTFNAEQCPSVLQAPNNAISEHQLKCILAKNKLANVARYLNGDWQYCPRNSGWVLGYNSEKSSLVIEKVINYTELSNIIFKTYTLAKQAVEILGEETIRLALEPLY